MSSEVCPSCLVMFNTVMFKTKEETFSAEDEKALREIITRVAGLLHGGLPGLFHLDKIKPEVKRRFMFWLSFCDTLDFKEDETKRVVAVKKHELPPSKAITGAKDSDELEDKELFVFKNRLSKANIGMFMRQKRGSKWDSKYLPSVKMECHSSGEILNIIHNDMRICCVDVTRAGNIEINHSESSPIDLAKLVAVLELECPPVE